MENKKMHWGGNTKLKGSDTLVSGLRGVAELLGNPTLILIATLVMQFAAALLLAQGKFLGFFAPFGVAFAAAAACYPFYSKMLRRLMPSMALAGAVIGYIIANGSIDGLKYCAASVLCFAAGLIFRETVFVKRFWFAPAVAGGSLILTNMVYLFASNPGVRDVLLFSCEAVMCAAAAFFYLPLVHLLHGPRDDKRERPPNKLETVMRGAASGRMALIASGISLVLVLADFTPFAGMSLGRMAGLFITLCATTAGPLYGCATGLVAGLALDISAAGAPSVAFVYAAAGLLSGALKKRGAFWTTLCFTAAHAAMLPWAWADAPVSVLYECFAAGVIYFMVSKTMSEKAKILIPTPANGFTEAKTLSREYEKSPLPRLRALTNAFNIVGSSIRINEPSGTDDIPASAYDIAVERVCRNCRINNLCWNREYQATRNALNEASEKIKISGRAGAGDFPPFFTGRCENLSEFIANVNENLALRDSRNRYRRRAADDSRLLGAQYDAMTQVLSEMSEELTITETEAAQETRELRKELAGRGLAVNAEFIKSGDEYKCLIHIASDMPRAMLEEIEDIASAVIDRPMRSCGSEEGHILLRETETLRAVVGVGLKQRRGEDESGDSAAYFRTDDGRLYMIIADGMGSGSDAARESAAFVRMMEGFLRAGVSVHTALRLLSPAFAVKCGGDNFTTCDILSVDLKTGEGECYKCGAAPTYICSSSGKTVKRVCSGSMPVGLPSSEPDADYTGLTLEAGDIVVMVSDGLTENDSDAWLTKLLSDHRFTSASNMASEILDAGAERTGGRDDMTVLVLKLSAMR